MVFYTEFSENDVQTVRMEENEMSEGKSVRRIAPYSEEAEKGVLGSILLDSVRVLNIVREEHVVAEDFYVPAHSMIFDAILKTERTGRGGVVDALTVSDTLKKSSSLEKVGGESYLSSLIESTPTAHHVGSYLDIVKDKAKRRRVIVTAMTAERLAYDESSNIVDVIIDAQTTFFAEASQEESNITNADAILQCYDEYKAAKSGNPVGLPSYIMSVNRKLGNYKPGKIHFIGAPPGQGKTTYICNQAKYWAMGLHDTYRGIENPEKVEVAIASIEMDHAEILGNIIAEHADVSVFSLKTGAKEGIIKQGEDNRDRLTKFMDAAKEFVDADTLEDLVPIRLNDKLMNIDQLCAWARLMVFKHGTKALFIDYLQLLKEPYGFRGSRKEEIDSICGKLVKLGKDTGLIILVTSQLTLMARRDNRKPNMSDLKESGAISEAAYTVMLIYKWEDHHYCGIDKNRGGLTGEVQVQFEGARQRFKAYVDDIKQCEEEKKHGYEDGELAIQEEAERID